MVQLVVENYVIFGLGNEVAATVVGPVLHLVSKIPNDFLVRHLLVYLLV